MRITMTNHEIASSSRGKIEVDTNRATISHAGEIYVISQRPDGVLQIEAPGGQLHIGVKVAYVTSRGSCLACASRASHGIDEPCEAHGAAQTQPEKPSGRGPRIVESPKPKRVKCDTCGSTIEYEPEDLFRSSSIPGSDDVGPMTVKCPKPRCGGRGYLR